MIRAAVGVTEQGHAMVLVTVSADGVLLDRRRVALTHDLPTHPHHHEGSWAVGRYLATPGARPLPLDDAIALVARVRAAAEAGAREAFAALAGSVDARIDTIALRACAPMPDATEARIRDHRAQTMADSVMYREVAAVAAESRGWTVTWYEAARAIDDVPADTLAAMKRTCGPPWQAAHRQAAAAALVALRRRA